jgi:hypothetical protein
LKEAFAVPDSVLEAIRLGVWDFEPQKIDSRQYDPTRAVPGSEEKLAVLAERVRQGLPLWHPADRSGWDDGQDD